jgi:hypothetical protein
MMWISKDEAEAREIVEKASKLRCSFGVRYSDMRHRNYGERWIVTVKGLHERQELALTGYQWH